MYYNKKTIGNKNRPIKSLSDYTGFYVWNKNTRDTRWRWENGESSPGNVIKILSRGIGCDFLKIIEDISWEKHFVWCDQSKNISIFFILHKKNDLLIGWMVAVI